MAAPSLRSNRQPQDAPRTRAASARPVIVVVEEDWRTRHFISAVLKYTAQATVLEAASPAEAQSLARGLEGPIDLLISGIALDHNGIQLAREWSAANPGMGVLLVSAKLEPPEGMPAAWRFLSKPFPTETLVRFVDSQTANGK